MKSLSWLHFLCKNEKEKLHHALLLGWICSEEEFCYSSEHCDDQIWINSLLCRKSTDINLRFYILCLIHMYYSGSKHHIYFEHGFNILQYQDNITGIWHCPRIMWIQIEYIFKSNLDLYLHLPVISYYNYGVFGIELYMSEFGFLLLSYHLFTEGLIFVNI